MSIDIHQFCIASQRLEKQVVEEVYVKAKKYEGKVLPSWKADLIAHKLSSEAYGCLKTRITEEFPSPSYSRSISLQLMSRRIYFVVTLPERLEVTILGEGSSKAVCT